MKTPLSILPLVFSSGLELPGNRYLRILSVALGVVAIFVVADASYVGGV
jgi:hypothetical protein